MMRAKTTDIRPLRGVRFDPDRAGPVGSLLAPPYDVATALSARTEFSIAGIENVNLGVPGDQHAAAAARYREWMARGILRRDDEPAIYLHEHDFVAHGESVRRTALFAVVRLEEWTERVVVPHERTMLGPRLEREARLRATAANLSPLYFLYADPHGDARRLVSAHLAGAPATWERDQVGGAHRLVLVTDPAFHSELAELLRHRRLFVADGHHRYESALAYRDEMRSRHGYHPEAPTEFVLAMLAAVDDPGVIVLPTHRLLLGRHDQRTRLLEVLRRWFVVEHVHAEAPVDEDPGHVCRVVLGGGGIWDVRSRPGSPHAALLPRDKGSAYRSLPVAAVEGVIESLRGAAEPDPANGSRVVYAIDSGDAIERALREEARAAFLLPRPRLDRVMEVGEEGDLLPAKSTWFEPKAPAGLVINDLRSW